MWGLKSSKIKLVFVSIIISLLLIGGIVGAIYYIYTSSNSKISPGSIVPDFNDDQLSPTNEPISTLGTMRGKEGGELLWSEKLSTENEPLSTPALCDLNPPTGGMGKKFLEIAVGCADDHIYVRDKGGDPYWTYSDCVIDDAITASSHISLDFSPPPLFSSVTPVDIGGGNAPELLIGVQNGILCLAPDGTTHWKDKGSTEGYYFSSVAVCDLEGDYAGVDADGNYVGYRDDLEIVLGSDDYADAQGYLECWQANGQEVFAKQMSVGEHAFMTCSIVAAELDGWLVRDGGPPESIKEQNPTTKVLYSDFLTSTHNLAGRIWKQGPGNAWNEYEEAAQVTAFAHQTYGTPAVGNFTGGPELECIIGYCTGHQWDSSPGAVKMYRQDGSEPVNEFVINSVPGGLVSSPVACDAQNLDPDKLAEDEKIIMELYFGCDSGVFYCLDSRDLSELWQFKTGGRIISSPAVCNINSDDRLEVVIGSDDGKVYCFEADPQELDRDGNANPKDDGVEDAGGESGIYDILWTFDTTTVEGSSGEIGISSPVVGDINYDGQLEVLIGDNKGTLYCISAGGSSVPGQVDWPKFHGDLNNTGIYNPGTSYGVKVDPQLIQTPKGPVRESLKKSVKPGESVVYNITVTNIGSSQTFSESDTFWLHTSQFVYKGGIVLGDHEWPTPILTGEDLEWSGGAEGLGEPYTVLQSYQTANITLTVTAPWSGDLGEFTQIEIEANSSMDPWARDSVQTTTNLEISLDFEIEILKEPVQDTESELYGQRVIKINPSDQATVEVSVKNKGNLNDTYDLRIDGVLWGWEAVFDKTESPHYPSALQLDAPIMEDQFPGEFRGSEGEAAFKIIAPTDAQENEILTLKLVATSKYSQNTNLIDNLTRYDYLLIEVNPVPDLELECREPRRYVVAGENTTFEVEVINRGNSEITVRLEQRNQLEPGWSLSFRDELDGHFAGAEPLVEVMNDGVTKVKVLVHAPKSAAAGDRQPIIIMGTTVTSGEVTLQSSATVALTAIVSQFFDINVTVNPPSISVDPGKTIAYNITVENEGNGDDFVIITPSMLEVNWDSTFYLNDEERVTSELDLNESVTFQMQISIPKNQLAGTYYTAINITGIGDRVLVEFDTVVNQIYNVSVYGVVHSQETSDKKLEDTIQPEPGVSPGSILHYVFEITNGGNAPDELRLTLASLGEDWESWEGIFMGITNTEAYMTDVDSWDFSEKLDISAETSPVGYLNSNLNHELHEMTLQLRVGQRVWLKVQITVPRDIETTDTGKVRNFNLNCVSTDPDGVLEDEILEDNDVSLILRLLFPDLVVVSNVRHPSHIANGEIVTISAEIKNDGDIEAREVLVTFYVDGKEVKTQTINLLLDGNSRLIPFTWQAMGGEHKLTIKVDPENAIVEKFENNNEKSKDVEVKAGGLGDYLSSREGCSIFLIILVVVFLMIILILIRKRGSIFGWKPGGGEY